MRNAHLGDASQRTEEEPTRVSESGGVLPGLDNGHAAACHWPVPLALLRLPWSYSPGAGGSAR